MKHKSLLTGLAICLISFVFVIPLHAQPAASKPNKYLVYVGTYTRGKSEGIYRFLFDTEKGTLTLKGVTKGVVNPSFLAIHPNKRFLYAVNEVGSFKGKKKSGGVSAFAINPKNGELTFLNHQPSLGGAPCHIIVDKKGKNVLVANYSGGNVAVFPIAKDGRLKKSSAFIQHTGSSVNPARQKGPHAHSINLDAANKFAFAADLGLDKVLIYKFDSEEGSLKPHGHVQVPPGSGPRHFDFHPNGRFAYVINEMKSTVTALKYHPKTGKLTALQTITTLPKKVKGNSTADIHVHPNGRFLYGSNRGHNSIAIFSIDQKTGKLTPLGHELTRGNTPRNFALDPSGTYLFAENQQSDTIAVFRINQKTGLLTVVDWPVQCPTPVCIKMIPLN